LAVAILIFVYLGTHSAAQDLTRPSEERPELPDFLPPAEDAPPLPAIEPGEALPVVPSGPSVALAGIRFIGNTALTDEELGAIAQPFVGRPVTAEDIEQLRVLLTRAYVERGYVNSGFVLPDQDLADRVLTLQVVEGRLTDIVISGTAGLDPEYIRGRLALGAGPPLDMDELGERFRILLQDPLIRRLDGELVPGLRPGEASLNVAVERAEPYAVGLTIDNDDPPSVGETGGSLGLLARNLTGRGDSVSAELSGTEGNQGLSLGVSIPVTPMDTLVHLSGEASESHVIEEPLDQIDIESRSWSFDLGVRHPVFKTSTKEYAFDLTFARRHSRSFLLGAPFSFGPGTSNGKSDVAVFRLAFDAVERGADEVAAARSTLNLGISGLGGTETGVEPDGDYFFWLGQFQYARRLGGLIPLDGAQVLVRADAQIAADRLLSLEQFAIGGASTVRGFRENQFVGDSGATGSIELRLPILELELPTFDARRHTSRFVLAPFIDAGVVWPHGDGIEARDTLASFGIGMLWDPAPWIAMSVYLGVPFDGVSNDPEPAVHGLQDKGVHVSISLRYP
jgi:hemolysin activation/secretion protein